MHNPLNWFFAGELNSEYSGNHVRLPHSSPRTLPWHKMPNHEELPDVVAATSAVADTRANGVAVEDLPT